MVTWAMAQADLPQDTGVPLVLITQTGGTPAGQRAQRRALALKIAERSFGLAALHIGTTESGALRFFQADKVPAPLYLSHATRGGLSAIAVSRLPVGVDLERIEPAFEPAWNILHPAERAQLQNLPPAQRHPEFLRLWTAKEACLKLIGTGLAIEPAMLELRRDVVVDHRHHCRYGLAFHMQAGNGGYSAAVAQYSVS